VAHPTAWRTPQPRGTTRAWSSTCRALLRRPTYAALTFALIATATTAAAAVEGVEGDSPATVSISESGDPEALSGAAASAGLFELLGRPPAAASLTWNIIQSKAEATDLLMSFAAVLVLLAVAAVAALIPAGGALRLSPAEAIRGA
jgi:ABC-type antimicrobial peptide transport system permease subunit